jgi:hypothetical protein
VGVVLDSAAEQQHAASSSRLDREFG